MANICDNIYSTCNVLFINMAWFVQEIFLDLNNIGKDLKYAYDETHNKTHLVNEISVKKYDYPTDEKQDYFGDEDWLESWDKV